MNSVYVNQVGYELNKEKKAFLNFEAKNVSLKEEGKVVFTGSLKREKDDDISGESIFSFDFSDFDKEGKFTVSADDVDSASFEIKKNSLDYIFKFIL